MDALKVRGDRPAAIALFREALALDPGHEDARYYLAGALAAEGQVEEALEQLTELTRVNPQSHRGYRLWGALKARHAGGDADLETAAATLEKALALNPEETGVLLLLGEVHLLLGQATQAEQRLSWACRTNPRAASGFFLRGYLAWKRGDAEEARRLLGATRTALGPEWKPEGTTAEGDVRRQLAAEETPLSRFWRAWDGTAAPGDAYAALDRFVSARPR